MPDVIAVRRACWEEAGLPAHLIGHYARGAQDRTTDGLLVFNTGHAFYKANRGLFDGCQGEVPSEAVVAAIQALLPQPATPLVPVPYADWPWWAKLVAKRRRDGENGVGDTFDRIASGVGGKRFEAWAKRRGINCGCKARRLKWTAQYPYHLLA